MFKQSRMSYLSLVAFLLIGFFAVRISNLDMFPLFIDETLAIERALATRMGDPLFFAGQGKVLLPWVVAPFVTENSAIFITRYVVMLIVILGAASTMCIAQSVAGRPAAILTLLLMALNPMLHFHDRLAISDTTLHPVLTLCVLFLLLAFGRRSPKWLLCIVAGCLFVGALLAKATALVMLPLPCMAGLLLAQGWSIKQRLVGLALVYGTIAVLWIPFYSFALWRGVDYFGRAAGGSTDIFSIQLILNNAQLMWNAYEGYVGYLMGVLLLVSLGALFYYPRKSAFLLSFALGFTFALVIVGDVLFYRYWVTSLPVLTALLAIALTAIPLVFVRWTAIGVVSLGFMLTGVPFVGQINHAPLTVSLPPADYGQYFQYDSAGTGLREIADALHDVSTPVLGMFVGCEGLQYYVSPSVDLTCLSLSGTEQERLARAYTEFDARTYTHTILETPGYIEEAMLDITLHTAYQVERPGGISQITIYTTSP